MQKIEISDQFSFFNFSRNQSGSVKSTTTLVDFRRSSHHKQRAQSLPDVLDSLESEDCDKRDEPAAVTQAVTQVSQTVTQVNYCVTSQVTHINQPSLPLQPSVRPTSGSPDFNGSPVTRFPPWLRSWVRISVVSNKIRIQATRDPFIIYKYYKF